ncbi:hypothetical protein EYF80_063157 [Liparis tanakae]|uniref:Uncharacterized protein n=1 Tax=Liparis tanakae TaxID=230148 RepID=A0A4Z2ECX5_9TELE|nr:hypothetical protein EYF80_063157 [Liparis tanakae]
MAVEAEFFFRSSLGRGLEPQIECPVSFASDPASHRAPNVASPLLSGYRKQRPARLSRRIYGSIVFSLSLSRRLPHENLLSF